MNWEQMCALDDRLTALLQEAGAYRVVSVATGKPMRTFSAESAANNALYKPDTNFCRMQLWHGLPQERGDVGLKFLMQQCVGAGAPVPELRSFECLHIATAKLLAAMPACNHDLSGPCPYDYPLPDIEPELAEAIARGERELLKRPRKVAFGSLLEQLRHAAGVGPEPKFITPETPIPDDVAEPVFIVKNADDAWRLKIDLNIRERFEHGEISRWYARECVYVCDSKTRKLILSSTLNKDNITGGLSFKPVVLTFRDEELERKLSSVCIQVLTIEGKKEKGEEFARFDIEQIRQAVKSIAPAVQAGVTDMPADVLDGWLGDVCRTHMPSLPVAYAWNALLSAASVLMPGMGKIRTNLYTGLIGPVGSGKTSAFELAFWLLNIKEPVLMNLKAGSSEGMAERIGDVGGAKRLVFVNELAHMLAKVNYEGSTFEQFLNDAYYQDLQELTVARRKQILFNCRLSLAGGLPENKFEELFGVGTAGGYHDRVCFGVCPTKRVPFEWEPLDGISPLLPELSSEQTSDDDGFGAAPEFLRTVRPQQVTIEPDVWKEKSRWEKELGIGGRAAEAGIRTAIIVAAFDCRGTLCAADLGPALAFAQYQADVHRRFEPNPGKTNEAVITQKILNYLTEHEPNGEKYLNRRKMFLSTHAYEFGPSVALRAMSSLESSGEIEQVKQGREWVIRLNPKSGGTQ